MFYKHYFTSNTCLILLNYVKILIKKQNSIQMLAKCIITLIYYDTTSVSAISRLSSGKINNKITKYKYFYHLSVFVIYCYLMMAYG